MAVKREILIETIADAVKDLDRLLMKFHRETGKTWPHSHNTDCWQECENAAGTLEELQVWLGNDVRFGWNA